MIAYAQNGIAPTEESVRLNIEVPFPVFKLDDAIKKPTIQGLMDTPGGAMPPTGMSNIADQLPDLDSLNVTAINQNAGSSLIPGMDQHLKKREVEKATEKMKNSQDSPWFLRPEDVQKYNNIFNFFNKSGTGVLSFEEAQQAFMQTQLDQSILEQVWGLVDTEEIGEFDRKMF